MSTEFSRLMVLAEYFSYDYSLLKNHFSNAVPLGLYYQIESCAELVRTLEEVGDSSSLFVESLRQDIKDLESALHLYRSCLIHTGISSGSAFLKVESVESVIVCDAFFNPLDGSVTIRVPDSLVDLVGDLDGGIFGIYQSWGSASEFWILYFG